MRCEEARGVRMGHVYSAVGGGDVVYCTWTTVAFLSIYTALVGGLGFSSLGRGGAAETWRVARAST
jgi:hypothetical protein